jgi:hypothetical protein
MLAHLRRQVVQTIAGTRTVALSTSGPAGLQSSRLPCEASDIELYVLVPRVSDHLFNLETQPDVAVVNETWNLNGQARVVTRAVCPSKLAQRPEAAWSDVIRIHPTRLTLLCKETGNPVETIDVDEPEVRRPIIS